jgi:hypothetical protein
MQNEVEQMKEMKETMRDLKRSENLIKFKNDIESRPQKQWFMGRTKRENIQKDSKDDLKNIKDNFEGNLTDAQQKTKRIEKRKESRIKEKQGKIQKKKVKLAKGESNFATDNEKVEVKKVKKIEDDSKKIFKKKKDLSGKNNFKGKKGGKK